MPVDLCVANQYQRGRFDPARLTWQWKNQTPGLSARKRRVTDPPGGIVIVSRRAGFA